MKRITDPSFIYTPAADTDIRRAIMRAWHEQAIAEDRERTRRLRDQCAQEEEMSTVYRNFENRRRDKNG